MQCFSCEQPIKKVIRCEFCAMKTCADCRLRRRQFPESIELDNGEMITGRICKVCDRKFLMQEFYNNKVQPLSKRNEDLRHAVQSYEMRLKAANYAITEESRLHDQLLEQRNDNNLKLAKAAQAKEQFEENIKRGQELLEKVENAFSIQMIDMQKGR